MRISDWSSDVCSSDLTGIVAERFGGQVLDTLGIENFISVQQTEGPKLAAQLEAHVKDYEVDVMNVQEAAELIPGGATGLHEVKLKSGASVKGKRSEEHTSELQSLMRNSYAVLCLKKKKIQKT